MGNNQTKNSDNTNPNNIKLPQLIDYLASQYILTQNFQDMKNLENKQYCDELIILTSRLIASELNNTEIQYLSQRTEQGVTVNKINKDNVIYFPKSRLNEISVNVPLQKKRLCIGIAKFYIKIAHIFSSISKTVNKQYNYKDLYGKNITDNKHNLPNNINSNISRISLCSRRLQALTGDNLKDILNNPEITIKNKICSVNQDNKDSKTLGDEPGISELKKLYYDVYNYDTGHFTSMSEQSQQQYKKDLELFYKTFTHQKIMPDNIKNFSDIKLIDLSKNKSCSINGMFNKTYEGNTNSNLFSNYANHVKKMIYNTDNFHRQLKSILDTIFVVQFNKITKHKEITINPKLTDLILEELVNSTRNIIIQLYLTCENDFVKGIELFSAIVEKREFENSKNKLTNLANNLNSFTNT
jgi:hypothetical protein